MRFPASEESRLRLVTVVAVTFLLATAVTAQVKAELTVPSNRVARDEILVKNAQGLEEDNAGVRAQIKALSAQIASANAKLAQTSTEAQRTQKDYKAQRDFADLTAAAGPGIVVDLASGRDPKTGNSARSTWQVGYLDIQDVVNLLWAAGAEAVAVNRQRIVPTSSFYVAGTDVLLNGVHLASPYRVEAIGDGAHFNDALAREANLSELKSRSQLYQLKFSWRSERTLALPAFDGAFVVRYAVAG
jgi:uncharacterized protein YlxW (UPF0749 family)